MKNAVLQLSNKKVLQSFTTVCAILISFFSTISHAQTILVHGDSLSAGYGMTPEETWVSLLANELGDSVRVVNSSISGETTKGGLERLPGLLEEYEPDIVVLELGANDGLRGFPIPQITENLQAMIDLSIKNEAQVVLLGIRIPPNYGSRYTKPFFNQFAELAERNDLPYLPFLLDGVAEYSDLMQPDGLHPTAEAQTTILSNVKPLIEPLLP